MGLFAVRCGLTGVALNIGPCSLVVLREVERSYVPVSLPLWRDYDGYGSIEDVEQQHPGTSALVRAMNELHDAERLTVNEPIVELPDHFSGADDVLRILCDGSANLSCDGALLTHTLLYAPAVRAIAKAEMQEATGVRLELEPAHSTYAHQATAFASELSWFARVDYAVERGLGWRPNDGGQYTEDEVREFFAHARSRYVGDRAMLRALDHYAEWTFEG